MLAGVCLYLVGGRELPADDRRARARKRAALLANERRRLAALFALVPVMAVFYVAQTQVWNVYNLWVRDHVQMRVGSFHVPIPWLQSLDGLAPLACLAPMLAFWRWQAKRGREPPDLAKVAIGCAIFATGMVWLALGDVVNGAARIPLWWPIGFHLLSNLGWLYFTPTMSAVFIQRAPPAMRGVMYGVFSSAIFASSLISGRLGGAVRGAEPAGLLDAARRDLRRRSPVRGGAARATGSRLSGARLEQIPITTHRTRRRRSSWRTRAV